MPTNETIAVGPGICMDFERAIRIEWLETNGLGGFASSTIVGANTRRYHGLLTAALKPPAERYVLLSKLEEILCIGDHRYELSANEYGGAVHPEGYRYLTGFRLDPFPVFTYQVDGVELEKRVFMPHGENTTVIEYEMRAPVRGPAPACGLEIRPLIAFRDYHSTTHANGALNPAVELEAGIASIQPYSGLPRLYLAHNAYHIEPEAHWYLNFLYRIETERGLDDREDLFCPLVAKFDLNRRPRASLIASTARRDAGEASALRAREVDRRKSLLEACPSEDAVVRTLALAADQFIVNRGEGKTVIAGYPWFSDWGRDTMIALPGLTLATGRPAIARSILLEFAGYIDRGMLPNCFPGASDIPEYNTADASLWYFEAIRSYAEYTGDLQFVRQQLYEKLKEMIDWHLRGTRYGIRADEDALLLAGEPGVQLTWMDAKIGGWVVTPRQGKAVEIQALWYNALCTLAGFAQEFQDAATQWTLSELADRTKAAFNASFWNEQTGCFYDVIGKDDKDASIRPNQLMALSLRYSMVSGERARQALAVIERELLTPHGLRTLSPADPNYRGRYEGPPWQRDAMYHQGTVWPWLMGPFITAYVRAYENSPLAQQRASAWIDTFAAHLREGCLGQVSEILDGDPPHTPRGAPAQAWSVAELLRAACGGRYPPPHMG